MATIVTGATTTAKPLGLPFLDEKLSRLNAELGECLASLDLVEVALSVSEPKEAKPDKVGAEGMPVMPALHERADDASILINDLSRSIARIRGVICSD